MSAERRNQLTFPVQARIGGKMIGAGLTAERRVLGALGLAGHCQPDSAIRPKRYGIAAPGKRLPHRCQQHAITGGAVEWIDGCYAAHHGLLPF